MTDVRPLYLVLPHHDGTDGAGVEAACIATISELSIANTEERSLRVAVIGYSSRTFVHRELTAPEETVALSLRGQGDAELGDALAGLCALIEDDYLALRNHGKSVAPPAVAVVIGSSFSPRPWRQQLTALCGGWGSTPSVRVMAAVLTSLGTDDIDTVREVVPTVIAFDPETFASAVIDHSAIRPEPLHEGLSGWPSEPLASPAPSHEDVDDHESIEAATDVFSPVVDTLIVGNPGRSGGVLGTAPTSVGWPDSALDAIETSTMSVRAASCRGRSHRFAGTPRQDAYGIRRAADGESLVIAVADGVSSGERSDIAARYAVNVATARLSAVLDGSCRPELIDWQVIVAEVTDTVLAQARGIAGRDLANAEAAQLMSATLLVAALTPVAGGAEVVLAYLGDTSAWSLRDGRWSSITPVKNEGAEVASSRVAAIPTHSSVTVLTHRLEVGELFVAMSDGVGDAMGSGIGELPAALAEAWSSVPGPHAFGSQVDFQRKSFDDDRTAVGVWLR